MTNERTMTTMMFKYKVKKLTFMLYRLIHPVYIYLSKSLNALGLISLSSISCCWLSNKPP